MSEQNLALTKTLRKLQGTEKRALKGNRRVALHLEVVIRSCALNLVHVPLSLRAYILSLRNKAIRQGPVCDLGQNTDNLGFLQGLCLSRPSGPCCPRAA